MDQRNSRTVNRIDYWRVVFTLLIMIFHFDDTYHLFPQVTGWYIAVEFFFLVSGYFLYDRFLRKGAKESALSYTVRRFCGIYPAYVIMFVVYYLILIPVMRPTFEDFAYHVLDSVPELLLMQGFGLGRGWNYVNNTTWYLSVMLVAGYFIYAMLRYRKELFLKVIGPLLVIACYAYLYRHNGSLDAVIPVEDFFRSYMLMRGFAGMMLGVYIHLLRERFGGETFGLNSGEGGGVPAYSAVGGALTERGLKVLPVLGSFSFILVIVLATQCRYTVVDYTYLLMIAFGVFTAMLTLPAAAEDGSILPALTEGLRRSAPGSPDREGVPAAAPRLASAAAKLSAISLEMYLLHDMFRAVILPYLLPWPETAGSKLILLALYIPAVTASAAGLHFAASRAARAVKERRAA